MIRSQFLARQIGRVDSLVAGRHVQTQEGGGRRRSTREEWLVVGLSIWVEGLEDVGKWLTYISCSF